MEKNNINESISLEEEIYEEHIKKTINNLNKYEDMKILGKILHYLDKPIFYYYCTALSNTKSNPFDIDIEFCFEFIDKEMPYVSILTDFNKPSLNDNRNFYRCLTKDYKYKFFLNKLDQQEKVLESLVEGIENFLTYLNESIAINAFVFFGEYEYDHIYQINDFFQTKNYIEFYRINIILNKNKEERYIIFTQLYFLLFEPLENDKALAKLSYYNKLKDMNFIFEKKEENNSLIAKLPKIKNINSIEFVLIDRERKEKKEEVVDKTEEEDEINEIKEKEEKEEKDEKEGKLSYSKLMKEWIAFQKNIKFEDYDIVLNEYIILFSDNRGYLKFDDTKDNKIKELNKHIEFNEKLVTLYDKLNNKNNDYRKHKLISNIIYLCSELVSYSDSSDENGNEYMSKIRKYINTQK